MHLFLIGKISRFRHVVLFKHAPKQHSIKLAIGINKILIVIRFLRHNIITHNKVQILFGGTQSSIGNHVVQHLLIKPKFMRVIQSDVLA